MVLRPKPTRSASSVSDLNGYFVQSSDGGVMPASLDASPDDDDDVPLDPLDDDDDEADDELVLAGGRSTPFSAAVGAPLSAPSLHANASHELAQRIETTNPIDR